ncbi:MAG: alpha/beta hydrolase-fold protein [Anaerolineales bacterium]
MPDSILERLKTDQTPLIDQNTATFVWRGRSTPLLVGDFTGWDEGKPIKLVKRERGLWIYQLELPSDAYIEYNYQRGEESLDDPFNPRRTPNGVGGFNQYFSMPEYKPTELDRKKRHVAHGTVREYKLPTDFFVSGNERKVYLYQPPSNEKVPLVVVWDGQDYLHRIKLNYMVDNLIAEGRIQPIALAFVSNGGQKSRMSEYACNEATLAFLMTGVMPLAAKELNLMDTHTFPGEFGVLGSSMGGLMALYTGARFPQVFGKVISQSGAFSWGDFDMVVFDLLNHPEERTLKIWIDVGIYDLTGLLDSNRKMRDLLVERNYRLIYREYHAGHNQPAWRDDIWRGLEALYGIGQ